MIFNFLILLPLFSSVWSFTLPHLDVSSAVDLKSTKNSIINSSISTTNFSISLVTLNILFSTIILLIIALSHRRTSHAIRRLAEEVVRIKTSPASNVSLPKS